MSAADTARLEVAAGFMIDELSIERLHHQLRRAGPEIVAIAAAVGTLPPGSSVHAQTQRSALRPLDDLVADPDSPHALVVRADVPCVVSDGTIRPEHGEVLLDPGAFAHDIEAPPGPLLPARAEARPVFTSRPVVLFLGCVTDQVTAAWAAGMVDALASLEVDARLALPDSAPPCRSSRPCLSGPESVRVLAPQVIVALDDEALDALAQWIPDDRRATTIISFDPDLSGAPTILSWRLGEAQDRHRATVGPGTDPTAVADLVNRLCSGPQPRPPILRLNPESGRAGRGEPQSIVILTGVLDTPDDRVIGLAETAQAAGHSVEIAELTISMPPAALHADLVLLHSVPECETIATVLDARSHADLPTVFDLGPGDLSLDTDSGALVPSGSAERLAIQCGRVTTVSSAIARQFEQLGVAVLHLPNLPTAADLARHELVDEWGPGAPLIGWRLEASTSGTTSAIADALHELQDRRPELIVQVLADPDDVPERIAGHARTAVTPGDDTMMSSWALQIWSPAIGAFDRTGSIAPVLDAGMAGVPTIVGATDLLGADSTVRRAVATLDGPEQTDWFAVVERLLDEPDARTMFVRRARDLATRMADHAWSDSILLSLLDWAGTPSGVDR